MQISLFVNVMAGSPLRLTDGGSMLDGLAAGNHVTFHTLLGERAGGDDSGSAEASICASFVRMRLSSWCFTWNQGSTRMSFSRNMYLWRGPSRCCVPSFTRSLMHLTCSRPLTPSLWN